VILLAAIIVALLATPLRAQQHFDAGGQVTVARSGEFDATGTGFGGRFAWRPVDLIGIEAEMNAYPGSFPSTSGFSRHRTEGLFGVTAGPRLGPMRVMARLRPGFLTFTARPTVCILIFPPPLSCQLGQRTVFALDVGGSVELPAGARTFARIDLGDRLLRYPGPSFRNGGTTRGAFFSHDFRLSAGAGVRF
jgi:hypothetical protein